MINKVYILVISILLVIFISVPALAVDSGLANEYKIKAALLYNFLLFTEWPELKGGSDEVKKPIVIGIVGKAPFKDAFKPVEGRKVNGRKLVIKWFKSDSSIKLLSQCDLLFISSSLKKKAVEKILKSLEKLPVLTVSERKGFLESKGMINLVVKKETIEIEINKAVAERVGIKFRSKLLRVAARVIEKKDEEKDG